MIKLTGNEDYYPTPESLLDQITAGLDWERIRYVLEPSAGRGNIADYVKKAKHDWSYGGGWREDKLDIDCIELEPELRAILKDKGLRVVHDDFLTFHTYKHYDLILMNPPFSAGARHLLKAIDIQKTTGGAVICILNAETIRNPYTNERKELAERLKEYGAEIRYYEKAFIFAERPTDVEVAVIKLIIPAPERQTTIFDTLREKDYEEFEKKGETSELAESDLIAAFVAQYNRELEWGLRLYDELLELDAKSLEGHSAIGLKVYEGSYWDKGKFYISGGRESDFSVNEYVRVVRRKYWDKFFRHPVFYSRLTSNLSNKYYSQVDRFADYDFSYWNIKTVQEEIAKSLIKGVEDCIIALFDKLSYQHSYDDDLKHNIHYYNGWKSNSSWKINRRIVIPMYAFRKHWNDKGYDFDPFSNGTYSELLDIEKVLNYLNSGDTTDDSHEISMEDRLGDAKDMGRTKNIHLKYFDVTFYKKGTCHLTFTNERLLKKFNIFGSQHKGWLPKGYARKRYEEFAPDEQEVIESFEGREAYNDTLMGAQYYLFEAVRSMPMLNG